LDPREWVEDELVRDLDAMEGLCDAADSIHPGAGGLVPLRLLLGELMVLDDHILELIVEEVDPPLGHALVEEVRRRKRNPWLYTGKWAEARRSLEKQDEHACSSNGGAVGGDGGAYGGNVNHCTRASG
jgi:hypothetical protein